MAIQDDSTNATSTTTDRVVAFFDDREKAYEAMSRLKESGIPPENIGFAAGDYQTSGTSGTAGIDTNSRDQSFWQKVKSFFAGDHHDDQTDFRDATNDWGWDEERYGYYQRGFSSGGAIVTVSGERTAEARRILQEYGGDPRETGFENNVIPGSESATGGVGIGSNRVGVEGERRIQLRGEMLRTYKERVQRGEVTLRKEVITENQSVNVPVTREELVVERTPGTGRASGEIGTGEEVRVPLSEERVRVEKQPVVNEEVRVGKRQVQSNKEVSDQVRHEELRVDKKGEVETPIEESGKAKKPAA